MPGRIATERLVLERPWPATLELAGEVFGAVESSRATLRRWLPWVDATLRSEDELEYLSGLCTEGWERKRSFRYAIRLAPTGAFTGFVALESVNERHCAAEAGFWLDDAHVGHGCVREAVLAPESAAFAAGLNRLVIRNDTRNTLSVGVAVATGRHLDGVLRQDHWDAVAGRFVDTNVFSRLKSDLQPCIPGFISPPCSIPHGKLRIPLLGRALIGKLP